MGHDKNRSDRHSNLSKAVMKLNSSGSGRNRIAPEAHKAEKVSYFIKPKKRIRGWRSE